MDPNAKYLEDIKALITTLDEGQKIVITKRNGVVSYEIEDTFFDEQT